MSFGWTDSVSVWSFCTYVFVFSLSVHHFYPGLEKSFKKGKKKIHLISRHFSKPIKRSKSLNEVKPPWNFSFI